jgi:pimeloyl-ACP methyl ester carboxylesterase
MVSAQAWVRCAGQGRGVVCLHSNASSSGQWRGLMELLASRYCVFAPDLYGAGRSPDWPSDTVIGLADEVDLIAPVLEAAGPDLILVGHSYGAAVALKAALRMPRRVGALVLYEPTLFGLIDAEQQAPNSADGIRSIIAQCGAALDRDDPEEACRCFIDYWGGAGAWKAMPEERRAAIGPSMRNVRRWGHALFCDDMSADALRNLQVPVLCLTGSETTASARGVARILASSLPQVQMVEFEGVGHMGPVTHPGKVNRTIARFLDATDFPGICSLGPAATEVRRVR